MAMLVLTGSSLVVFFQHGSVENSPFENQTFQVSLEVRKYLIAGCLGGGDSLQPYPYCLYQKGHLT